jgi:APA family basic amino acid/polyamine antiporter
MINTQRLMSKLIPVTTSKKPKPELKRALGLFDATAISIGAIIGAGIFVVTGIVAGMAGPSIIVSIIVAGIIASFTALNFAQLSAYMPKEGGGYAYTYKLISPFAGFLAGWMWVLSNVFTGAAVSLGFAQYLTAIFPILPISITAAVICILFTVLNTVGVRESATINNSLVTAKIIILLFFVGLGLSFINFNNFQPFAPKGSIGILEGAALMFFAYGGYARVTTVAEEVKDAGKTIPKAIILALVISTLLYILISFVAVGLVGFQTLASSTSPLTTSIEVTGIPTAGFIISVGAMIATASVLLMTILGVSRMSFAMARNGQFPTFLSRIHPKFQTPYYAVWVTGALSTLLVFGDFSRVVAVGTFALLFHHALVNFAALKLRSENRRYPVLVSAIGFLLCLSLLVFLSRDAWLIGITGLAVGALYYYFGIRRRQTR